MSTNPRDALIDTSIKNNLTNPQQLRYWRNSILMAGRNIRDDNIARDILDRTLSNTTVKRACCLGAASSTDPRSFAVQVRIPIPRDFNDLSDTNRDFGFIDKIVNVPRTMCDSLQDSTGNNVRYARPNRSDTTYSRPCDDFYKLYCENMLAFYVDEYKRAHPGQKIDSELFATEYKPECACFNVNSDFPPNVPLSPRCLQYAGCRNDLSDQGLVYLDFRSRDRCPENITICSQVIDLSNTTAGGNINISAELQNTCGGQPGWDRSKIDSESSQSGTGISIPVTIPSRPSSVRPGSGSNLGPDLGPDFGPDLRPDLGPDLGPGGVPIFPIDSEVEEETSPFTWDSNWLQIEYGGVALWIWILIGSVVFILIICILYYSLSGDEKQETEMV